MSEIDFAKAHEGIYYGEGTASLIQRIKDALDAVEGPSPKNPKLCADAMHKVLRTVCEAQGMKPDIETFMSITGNEGRREYKVSWESGPHDWAIQCSFVVMDATGRLCEPYFGFDLCLYDVE